MNNFRLFISQPLINTEYDSNNFSKMVTSPIETPSQKWACESKDCDKAYASKGYMKVHFKKCHNLDDGIQSPLGKFPSARVLFDEEEQPAVQGNSAGDVNSPKVVSAAIF